jgi:6,7-dimethyl-8-ribityllumazine synthase
MASPDLTVLPSDAKSRAADRVGTSIDGSSSGWMDGDIRVGVACAEFNGGITDRLLSGVLDGLAEGGCHRDGVTVAWVPGAFELPLAAQELALSGAVDAGICLGAVIRGDTGHYDFVAGQCASGLQRVQLDTGVPVVFGVLTTETLDQALDRSKGDRTNKGREAAVTAIQMVRLLAAVGNLGKPSEASTPPSSVPSRLAVGGKG